MQRRLVILLVGLTLICAWGAGRVQAQGSLPQTYSLTVDPAFSIFGPTRVTIIRDGSKEVVDQFAPPGPGRPKEFHNHIVYDFQAHKVYSKIVSDSSIPCGVQDYPRPIAPPELDVISGTNALIHELTQGNAPLKPAGTETVNGVPTKVMEVGDKYKVWIAQNGGFLVKVVGPDSEGKATTLIEVKDLSFAKPPASAFTPPSGCNEVKPRPAQNPRPTSPH